MPFCSTIVLHLWEFFNGFYICLKCCLCLESVAFKIMFILNKHGDNCFFDLITFSISLNNGVFILFQMTNK